MLCAASEAGSEDSVPVQEMPVAYPVHQARSLKQRQTGLTPCFSAPNPMRCPADLRVQHLGGLQGDLPR
jgi:hypothetical protein